MTQTRDLATGTPDMLDLWIVEQDMLDAAEALYTDPFEDHRD